MFLYTDCPNVRAARVIGIILVRERLAACANWWRITSTYVWRGRQEERAEAALLIKTSERAYAKAARRLRELHSYELPAIVAWRSSWSYAPYEIWVRQVSGVVAQPGGKRSTTASRPSSARRRRVRA